MPKISEQLRKANTANIVKKAKSGKTLTTAEIAAVEDFEQDIEKQDLIANGAIIRTTVEIAQFFDVTTMTITNWQKNGFPKIKTNCFDLKKCFDWWCDNINANQSKEADNVRERYWKARAEAEEIKVAKVKGELIPKESVFKEFAARAGDLKTSLRALKHRASGQLANKDQDEVMQILGREIDEMLRNFCRKGKYTGPDIIAPNNPVSVDSNTTNNSEGNNV